MKVASWAFLGSLLINTAFGLVVVAASATGPSRPVASLFCAHRHAASNPHAQASASRYLAAVRMGWAIG